MQFVYNFAGGGDAPKPMTKEKTYYQSRQGVKPTTTANLGFPNSSENGPLKLYPSTDVMPYTSIDGRAPTGVERGMEAPAGQSRKGA